MGLPVLLLSTLGFILPREKLSHIVSPGDPAASGLLKINKTAFSSITVLVGLIISSRPGGTLCTPRAPSSVGITFCTYLAGVHGPLMHMPGRPISSATQSCPTLCDPMDCSTPWTGLPVHHQLPEFPKLMSVESLMLSNHLILCCPFLLPPSIFPSTRVFSNESALHIRWPKDWSFSVNISPSNEHSGLTSFRMDWLYLLEVQGTLKSLLQHHSSKASILKCSAFFTVQLSHPYMTTGKTIALTRWTFVGKVMSLLFNMLRVPWTVRRSNESILEEISSGCSLEGLILKLKLQYFGHLMQRADSFEDCDAEKD